MKSRFVRPLVTAAVFTACAKPAGAPSSTPPAASSSAPQVVDYEAPGNLQSTHRVGCVEAGKLVSTYTPADLFPSIPECISQNRIHDAATIYALAGVYGRYDQARVADESAHQAMSVLGLRYIYPLPKPDQDRFSAEITRMSEEPKAHAAFCRDILAVGRPNYHPAYMIQHGIGAFEGTPTKDGLVARFDPAATWKKVLDEYLHCSLQ
jgi:hypothetical protein